jgi:ribosomal-protein-alanine N-acetyltransferase
MSAGPQREPLFADLPDLDTPRLRLRRVRPEDAADLFAFASDPLVTRYITWPTHRTLDDSRALIARFLAGYARGAATPWGIEHKADGRLIGTCGFTNAAPAHARAEVIYNLARPYWGQGYMPEAVRAALTYGFDALGLNRIEAGCLVENAASARVLEKVGMTFEGVLREYLEIKGDACTLKQYAILRRDWQGRGDGAARTS